MKKKILFLCSNMNIGGFQRSLISLLKCFDYSKYEVDLLLADPDGIFSCYLPEQVNVLQPIISPYYYASFPKCIIALLRQGYILQSGFRIIGAIISRFNKGAGFVFSNKVIPSLEKEYDAAIDYNGQQLLYYLVDKVKAKKKISFFHSDYKKWDFYQKTDRKYYGKVNAIVTVSDECVASMKEIFPEYAEKIFRVENIISPNTVFTDSTAQTFKDGFDGIRVLTVGRVHKDKGFELAIESCKILKNRGFRLRWYWVGPYQPEHEQKIKRERVEDVLYLLGRTGNPYRYMKDADILCHPSYYEGKSVTVEEAKVLQLPIVATSYSTVYDQIENEKSGLIVDINAESIANGIQRLINDESLRINIKNYQKKHCVGNECEVDVLYSLIEA